MLILSAVFCATPGVLLCASPLLAQAQSPEPAASIESSSITASATDSSKSTPTTSVKDKTEALPDAPKPQCPTVKTTRDVQAPAPVVIINDNCYTECIVVERLSRKGLMKTTFAPSAFVGAAIGAGISQAHNGAHEYGQGAEGYGKRFGASFADSASYNFFGNYALPSLLHQGSLYVRSGSGGVGRRSWHAMKSAFVTRHDGECRYDTFNTSVIGGHLLSASLANAYRPESQRGAGSTFVRFGVGVGATIGENFFREFWPDIKRKLLHRQ